MTLKSSTIKNKLLGLVCLAGVLSACTATLNTDSNPFLRKFGWFSYLEGGDFRNSCETDRYRMVYNAVYTEQIRIYNVTPSSAQLHTRIMNTANAKDLESVETWQKMLSPWNGQVKDITLSPSELSGLVDDLEKSGAFGQPNVGEELPSKGFYWTIAACQSGKYHFTGFTWPSEKWANLSFADRLFALDTTDLPVNPPRKKFTSKFFGK